MDWKAEMMIHPSFIFQTEETAGGGEGGIKKQNQK